MNPSDSFLLLQDYYHLCDGIYPFSLHPLSSLIFYPEANLSLWNKSVIASDFMGEYIAFVLEEDIEGYLRRCSKINRVVLKQISSVVSEDNISISYVDDEFVYDLRNIRKMFKKRRPYLYKADDLFLFKVGWPAFKEVSCVVTQWTNGIPREGQSLIMAQSVMDVLTSAWQVLMEVRDKFDVVVGGLYDYKDERILGFSVAIKDGCWGFVLFEFVLPSVRWASCFLFYKMCLQLKEIGVIWLNTLGWDGIEGLRLNKISYKPAYLIPIYKIEKK